MYNLNAPDAPYGGPALLPEQEPQQYGYLGAPPEYVEPYSQSERLSPTKMMWAGLLSDIGGYLGSGGMRPMGNTGMRMYMQANQMNNRQQAANAQAKNQHWRDQMAYGQAQQVQANTEFNQNRAVGQDAATADWRESQTALGQDRLQLQRDKLAFERQLMLQDAALTAAEQQGANPEMIKLHRDLGKDFQSATQGERDLLSRAQQAKQLISQNTGLGDLTALISLVKTLDPGSVVSSGEVSSVEQAAGLKAKWEGWLSKAADEGSVGATMQSQINNVVDSLIRIAENDYNRKLNMAKTQGEQQQLDTSLYLPQVTPFNEYRRETMPQQVAPVPKEPVQMPSYGIPQNPLDVVPAPPVKPRQWLTPAEPARVGNQTSRVSPSGVY